MRRSDKLKIEYVETHRWYVITESVWEEDEVLARVDVTEGNGIYNEAVWVLVEWILGAYFRMGFWF